MPGLVATGLPIEPAGNDVDPKTPPEPRELLVRESRYQTYRHEGRKALRSRRDGRSHLFDLRCDPGAQAVLPSAHPDDAERILRCIAQLAVALATEAPRATPEPRGLERPRAIGCPG